MKFNKLPEHILLIEIKRGNYEAFEELYERYFDILYGLAFNLLRDKEAILDIIQDIFLWFWQNRGKWELVSCKGYLIMAVKYKISGYFRANKVKNQFYDYLETSFIDKIDESTQLEAKMLQEFLDLVVEDLPERCKAIFKLSRNSQLNNKEIAQMLKISEKTVEAQITIALKRIRESLRRNHFLIIFLYSSHVGDIQSLPSYPFSREINSMIPIHNHRPSI
ncbi:RNA polymerase sigma-70 factor [Sphingobacterium sp.]|uniref:RNA polymerase sigma-70 factor n=1 Tax=Sphingobacterium sp. TaxID=341027 RepID=UPI0031DC52C4